MFSIYSSAFNIEKNSFDFKTAFENYLSFADEVVISTINDNEDSTISILKDYSNKYKNFKFCVSNLKRKDPLFWGKLRNEALEICKEEFCISLDLDEYIPNWQKYNWINFARNLSFSDYDAYLVPLLNLWADKSTIRWDTSTNYLFKWVLHKNLKFPKKLKRGAVNFAKKNDGTVDITKSDTNELIYEDGELVRSKNIITDFSLNPENYIQECTSKIFIYHTGYLNFENRLTRNKNFWNEQFKIQAGHAQEEAANKFAPLNIKDLENKSLIKHGLKLWNEK